MKKKKYLLFIVVFALLSLMLLNNISFSNIFGLPADFYVSYNEVKEANKDGLFGKFVNLNLNKKEIETDGNPQSEDFVVFKLFGLIPIKKVKVKLLPDEEVYLGGTPIGLTIYTDGVLVVSDGLIDMKNSNIKKNDILKNGDIIKSIDGKEVKSLEDINEILKDLNKDEAEITYIRNNKEKQDNLSLLKDSEGKYKLGVWVKDDLSGIGTLTFVRKNKDYGALGHAITNGQQDNIIPMINGSIYDCSLIGINKGEKNNPGELKCVFISRNRKGDIKKNTKYGIYGHLDNLDLVDNNISLNMGGRLSVKPGKAKIISNVSGIREEYEIEIIKANYQTKSDDKSIVFRVTDERLLNLTGGIIQGMSGSPIIQNNKVVGAVTHVFLSDPTKGYGVYTDWMLEQMDFQN